MIECIASAQHSDNWGWVFGISTYGMGICRMSVMDADDVGIWSVEDHYEAGMHGERGCE